MRHLPLSIRLRRHGSGILRPLIALVLSWFPTAAANAQDASYDAWARVFDAMNPGWRGEAADDAAPAISPEDLDILSEYASGPVRNPTARERAAFARLDEIAPMLAEASDHRTFDAGVDWNQGFSVLLPHLSAIRQSARCLKALSHRAAADGDAAQAAVWTGRIAGAAGQVAQDGTLIGSLVGGAIYSLADSEFDWLTASGMLDAATARDTLDAMGWLADSEDPFGVMNAMTMEQDIMSLEMARLADGLETGDAAAVEQLTAILGTDVLDAGDLSADEVRAQAVIMHDLQSSMIDAAADPDRRRGLDAMREIEAEIADPDTPALVASLMPSLSRVLETRLQLETSLVDRVRLLEAIASGRVSPRAVINAAILWERLGTLFETLPGSIQLAGLEVIDRSPSAERLELLVSRAVGEPVDDLRTADATGTAGSPLDTWWAGTIDVDPEIRELATIAAAVTAADFPASKPMSERYRVASDDLARVRGAGCGLVIDATARLRKAMSPTTDVVGTDGRAVDAAFERHAAAEEIVAVLALVHDLLADPALAHIVVSTDLMTSVDRLLRSPEAAPMLADATRRDRIITALTVVPRAISLGAAVAGHADLELFDDGRMRRLDDDARARLRERLARLDADRVYALLLADSGLAVRSAAPTTGDPPTPITPPEDPEGSDSGYRPLRLIATLEGVHGSDHVLTQAPTSIETVNEMLAGDPSRRSVLDRAIPMERYPLEHQAATTLALITELDDLLAGIGRSTRSKTPTARDAR